jgi:arylsulfatase A-like enzyme
MQGRKLFNYKSLDLVIVAGWWGLVAGLMEGIRAFCSHLMSWRDVMGASIFWNPLLFSSIAIIIVCLNWRVPLKRETLVRATLGFSWLAIYDLCDGLIPRWVVILPFLIALILASVCALVFHRHSEDAIRFQRRSLLFLGLAAMLFVASSYTYDRIDERRQVSKLPVTAPGARNAIVVVIDTLRADHLSAYGYSRPTSPNLDTIARMGVQFDNAISTSSWTLPSHASMLTAEYPHEHHVDHDTSSLGPDHITLGEALQARGYRTAAFSGNTGNFSRDRGFGRGFMRFEDDFQSIGSSFGRTYYGGKFENRLCQLHIIRDLFGRPSAGEINKRALRWIDSGRGDPAPFFLFLNYYDTHDPYLPPDPYLHAYTRVRHPGGRYTQHWEWFQGLTPPERQAALDAYDGAITYVDARIGELMANLRSRGLSENTIVIVTSDHGEAFNDHGLMTHGNSLYRELIHVPLIIWDQAHSLPCRHVRNVVSLTALPTIVLDLLGTVPEPRFASVTSRVGCDQNEQYGRVSEAVSELAKLNWSPKFHNFNASLESLTTSEWHYIRGGDAPEQLYRCCNIPEDNNIASTDEGRKVCAQFRHDLAMLSFETGDRPLTTTRAPQRAP